MTEVREAMVVALNAQPLIDTSDSTSWDETAQRVLDALKDVGYVCAPVEPTKRMILVGRIPLTADINHSAHVLDAEIRDAYKAMLAASQQGEE